MKNVLFIIPIMTSGGAARVVANLANRFDQSPKHKVSILTHVAGSKYDLNPSINWVVLFPLVNLQKNLANKLWRRLVYWPKLYSAVKDNKPDAVISNLLGMNWRMIVVCKLLRIKIIVVEHTNHKAELTFFFWFIRRWVYKSCDVLVVLTPFDFGYYSKFITNVHLIPNPLSFDVLDSVPLRSEVILAAGDLNRWEVKGFDLLLEVFLKVSEKHPEWILCVAGPGETGRQKLSRIVSNLGLSQSVEFPGFVKDISGLMSSSSIFIVSSRYEGFSMVLLEAMAMGCACISFDCESGPGELIEQNVNGVLTPPEDIDAMAEALSILMVSQQRRNQLGSNAIQHAKKYSIDCVFECWQELI